MSIFWLEYAIFPILLFFLSACLVTGLPLAAELLNRREHRGRSIDAPDSQPATDRAFAAAR